MENESIIFLKQIEFAPIIINYALRAQVASQPVFIR